MSDNPIDYDHLQKILASATSRSDLNQAIVNAPFSLPVEMTLLFLGIVVLLRANTTTGNIDRIALSRTELAEGTVRMSPKKFHDITIPLNHENNIISQAIRQGEPQSTSDWRYLFEPALTPEEARFNQAGGAISYSAVYPLKADGGGALIFSYYQYPEKIAACQRSFMERYSQLVDDRLRKLTAA